MNIALPQNDGDLDAVFSALSDPTRRQMLMILKAGDASVNTLTSEFNISQPAISRHLKVLEAANLITRIEVGVSRPAHLQAQATDSAILWLQSLWPDRMDRIADLLETIPD